MKLQCTIAYTAIFLTLMTGIKSSFAADYFVNDNSTTNDVFCSNIGDNSNNGTSATTPKETLTAIWNTYGPSGSNTITSGDNIYVDAGTYFQTDANLTLNINGISIIGAGSDFTIFDNNQSSTDANKFATITGDNITISGIYLTGYNYGFGGANVISIDGAQNLNINNVITNENNPGGGSSSIVITGGANVSFDGGGSNCNPGSASVAGGGINIEGNSNTVSINNYTLSANEKDFQGGSALYIVGNNTTLVTITNSILSNNVNGSSSGGGAIFIANGAQLNVSGTCFNNNEASQTSSVNYGGAIGVGRGSSITVDNCSFSNNIATSSGNGGAISVFTGVGSTGTTASATITNCSFSNNVASDGSDILAKRSFSRPANISINNCTFSGTSQDITVESSASITASNSGSPTNSGVTFANRTAPLGSPTTTCPSVINPCFSLLPVEFIDFTANCDSEFINFEWSTATELNNSHFIIESASDNFEFSEIATVKGNGTILTQSNYNFRFSDYNNHFKYFKLKQADTDGRIKDLKTISISSFCSIDLIENIHFNEFNQLVFNFNSKEANELDIGIITTDGRTILNEEIRTNKHQSEYKSGSINSITSGIYLIQFKHKSGKTEQMKVYKN